MTMGQLMFVGGAVLLVFAIVLAIIFARKRPQYEPEGVMREIKQGGTQRLRNGYPTEEVTMEETEALTGTGTEVLPEETECLSTERQGGGTSLLVK